MTSRTTLAATNANLERKLDNAVSMIFGAGPALSRLIMTEMVNTGPTDDRQAVKFASEDATITVNPKAETITFIDPAGSIPTTVFEARDGRLDLEQQTTLLGLLTRAKAAKAEGGSDPVDIGFTMLTPVVAASGNTTP